jgi:hypothetical protein
VLFYKQKCARYILQIRGKLRDRVRDIKNRDDYPPVEELQDSIDQRIPLQKTLEKRQLCFSMPQ